jgi:hypothetical protein
VQAHYFEFLQVGSSKYVKFVFVQHIGNHLFSESVLGFSSCLKTGDGELKKNRFRNKNLVLSLNYYDICSNVKVLQACFASIHFVSKGSLHLRNVSRDGKIPQNIFQHLAGSNLLSETSNLFK